MDDLYYQDLVSRRAVRIVTQHVCCLLRSATLQANEKGNGQDVFAAHGSRDFPMEDSETFLQS